MKPIIREYVKNNYPYQNYDLIPDRNVNCFNSFRASPQKYQPKNTLNLKMTQEKLPNQTNKTPLVNAIKSELSSLKIEMNRLIQRDNYQHTVKNYKSKEYISYRSSNDNNLFQTRNPIQYKPISPSLQSYKLYIQETPTIQIQQMKQKSNANLGNHQRVNYAKTAKIEFNKQYQQKQQKQTEEINLKVTDNKKTTKKYLKIINQYKKGNNQQQQKNKKVIDEKEQKYINKIENLEKQISQKQQQLIQKNKRNVEIQKQMSMKNNQYLQNEKKKQISKILETNLNFYQKQVNNLIQVIKNKDNTIQNLSYQIKQYQIQIIQYRTNKQKVKENKYQNQKSKIEQIKQKLQKEINYYKAQVTQALRFKEESQKIISRDKIKIEQLTKAKQYAQKQINIIKQLLNLQINKLKQQLKQIEIKNQIKIQLLQNQIKQYKLKDIQTQKETNSIFKCNYIENQKIQKFKHEQFNIKEEQKESQTLNLNKQQQFTKISNKKECLDDNSTSSSANLENINAEIRTYQILIQQKQRIIKNLHHQVQKLLYQLNNHFGIKEQINIYSDLIDSLNDQFIQNKINLLNKKYDSHNFNQ